MTARDDNPELHRIEVDEDFEGKAESVRFVCDGGDDAPCHHWPDCDCEAWGESHFVEPYDHKNPGRERTPRPGHEDAQQSTCWIDPWFNDAIGHDPSEWIDAWDGSGDEPTLDDLHGGPISVTFEGEYMTWEYAS